MSEQETHLGKLIPVTIESTVEEKCKELCKLHNINTQAVGVGYDSYKELLEDMLFDEYIFCNDILYKIEDEELEDVGYYCKSKLNPDKSISYVTSFYNGGTCLQEILEDEAQRYANC